MKKLLALVLALVMTLSLCVTSNAAFADAADIEHTEAVDVMNALGVINGKGDNKFDPKGNVTRAEMAKMISIVMLGDVDVSAFKGTTTDLKDIAGHWAEGYIKYCYSQGVIAGKGAGIFDPNADVTALEAAKMLLVAIGYNATVQGYVGGEWAINVVRDAQLSGFYDELTGLTSSKVLTRDEAAQMIYNAIGALLIEKSPALNVTTGTLTYSYKQNDYNKTLLSETFGATTKYGYMTANAYNSDKAEWTYTISTSYGSAAAITTDAFTSGTFKSTKDYTEFMGMKLAITYKVVKGDVVVYGLSDSSNELKVTAVGGDVTVGVDKITVDKVDYKVDTAVTAFSAGQYFDALSGSEVYSYDFYDVDGDGKIEMAVVAPFAFGQVTFKGNTSATVKFMDGSYTSYTLSKIHYFDDMAKDDYVFVTLADDAADDKVVLTKADVKTGKVEAVKSSTDVKVDGAWYEYVGGGFEYAADFGDEMDYVVANGFLFANEKVNGTKLDNILYVVDTDGYTATEFNSANLVSSTLGTYKGVDTRVVLPDGSDSVIKAQRVDVMKDMTTDAAVKAFRAAPGLYTYKVNDNGVYELKAVKAASTHVSADNNSYYAANAANLPLNTTLNTATAYYVKGATNKASTLDGKVIADDAVFYLYDSNAGKSDVVTGAVMKTMQNFGSESKYLTKTVNGVETVVLAYVKAAATLPVSTTSTGYGYVTVAGSYSENADDEGRITFTVWNGTESVELTDVTTSLDSADTTNTKYAKGAFVYYTKTATDGEVKDVTDISGEVAITGFDNGSKVDVWAADGTTDTNNTLKDNNKTVIIYVDTKKVEGVEGGSLALAQKVESSQYILNAVVKVTADEYDVIFVDVNNNLEGATYQVAVPAQAAGFTTTKGISALANNSTATSEQAGDVLVIKFTTTGATSAAAKVVATITLADGTTATASTSLGSGAAAGNYSIRYTMPAMNITGISLDVE